MAGVARGLVAEFDRGEKLVAAVKRLRAAGYGYMETSTPEPVEGLAEALGRRRPLVPIASFIGGVFGGCGMLGMEWYSSVVAYPLNIGGRPAASWPAFGPPGLEVTLLCAGLFGFLAFLYGARLPHMYHPAFEAAALERTSHDRHALVLKTKDTADYERARQLLLDADALTVTEIGT